MAPLSLSLKAVAVAFSLFASSSAVNMARYPAGNATLDATGSGVDSIYPVPPCTFTKSSTSAAPTSTSPAGDDSGDDSSDDSGDDSYPSATVTSSSSTAGYPLLYHPSHAYNGSAYHHGSTSKPGYGYGGVTYTTSTVYSTKCETITSCAASVTDCPARTITKVYAIYTTVCPVGADLPTTVPAGYTSAYGSEENLTSKIVFFPVVSSAGGESGAPAESTPVVVYETVAVAPVPDTTATYVPGGAAASTGLPVASNVPFTGGAAASGKLAGSAVAAALGMLVGILLL